MIIIYIFNNPVIVFLMSILFLWSAIKIVKYLKEKKSFGSIPLVYRVTFLVSFVIFNCGNLTYCCPAALQLSPVC